MDKEKFTINFNENYPRLCRVLRYMLGDLSLAQDIAQETLLRFYQQNNQDLSTVEIRAWLFRVAHNLALNEIAKRQTKIKFFDRVASFFKPKPLDPQKNLENQEQAKELADLLKLLPEDQRLTLLLREQEEMSYQEIAKVLNVSESKVKVDIFRARNTLRAKWQISQKSKQKSKQVK